MFTLVKEVPAVTINREQQEHVDRMPFAACRNSEVESPESIYEKYVTGKVLLPGSLDRMA